MRRNSVKTDKSKLEHKVVKKCSECEKEIPVACKTCPLCKSLVVSAKAQKSPPVSKPEEEKPDTEKEKEPEVGTKIRRTERIRRERPDFFNALEVDNRFKKKRRRKESVESSNVTSDSAKASTSSKSSEMEEADTPKKKRGRPRSVNTFDLTDKMSESKSPTPPEEDWYAHLPAEKFMQYKIILAEINKKITTQNFNPV